MGLLTRNMGGSAVKHAGSLGDAEGEMNGDGLSNYPEYSSGTDPHDEDSATMG
jgi:hypothetical protein